MDNKELESILKSRFTSVQAPVSGASLVPEIMARVARAEHSVPSAVGTRSSHDWVLVFAWLLGALVCLASLQGLDVQGYLDILPINVFGAYAQSAATLAAPLLGLIVILPMAWLLMED